MLIFYLRLAIRYHLRRYGSNITRDEMETIDNKRDRLQRLIDIFEHHGDSILHTQELTDGPNTSLLDDYNQFDDADDLEEENEDAGLSRPSSPFPISMRSDKSETEAVSPEDYPIALPSSLGWDWCVAHGMQSLAEKEAKLRHAQANWCIRLIRIALGFKSTLFRTQVRPAKSQTTKTRAQSAVQSVDATVHEHARTYSMARDAARTIQEAYPEGPELPELIPEDLRVATLILGGDQVGQRNKQRSWIWSFGKTTNHDGIWMHDCALPFILVPYECLHF